MAASTSGATACFAGIPRSGATRCTGSIRWACPPSEFRGGFEGDVLTLVNAGPQGVTRAVFELGQDSYTYRMQVSPDGTNWFPFMEGTYSRED